MNTKDQESFSLMLLADIRAEQQRMNDLLQEHAVDDAQKALSIQKELEAIRISVAKLETKVEHHSGVFGKAWAVVAPIIVSLVSIFTLKG